MQKRFTDKEMLKKIAAVAIIGSVFAYLNTRTSSSVPYTPTVDRDCIDRLIIETNGRATGEELKQRCIR